jgi:hypothetical protein
VPRIIGAAGAGTSCAARTGAVRAQAAIAAASIEIFMVNFPLVGSCSEERIHSSNPSADQMARLWCLATPFFGHADIPEGTYEDRMIGAI